MCILTYAAALSLVFILIPKRWLLMLLPFAVIFPVGQLPVNPKLQSLYPSLIAVVVLILRKMLSRNGRKWIDVPPFVGLLTFVGVLFLIVNVSYVNNFSIKSIAFVGSIVIMIYVLPLLHFNDKETLALFTGWQLMILVVGIYSLIEFAFRKNFLLGNIYSRGNNSIEQSLWSTYRSTSLVGHPLVLTLIMSLSAILFYSLLWQARSKSNLFFFTLSSISCLTAVSRYILVLIPIIFLISLFVRHPSGYYRQIKNTLFNLPKLNSVFLPIAIIVLSIIAVAPNFFNRNSASEGLYSISIRLESLGTFFTNIELTPLGKNTGNVLEYYSVTVSRGYGLENSLLQMVAGLGMIGSLLLVIQMYSYTQRWSLESKRTRLVPLMFILTLAFFNFFDGYRYTHALFAVILILARYADALEIKN